MPWTKGERFPDHTVRDALQAQAAAFDHALEEAGLRVTLFYLLISWPQHPSAATLENDRAALATFFDSLSTNPDGSKKHLELHFLYGAELALLAEQVKAAVEMAKRTAVLSR